MSTPREAVPAGQRWFERRLPKPAEVPIEDGEFKPVIDRRYRLDQIVEAYTYVETGQKIGNVVVSVAPAI